MSGRESKPEEMPEVRGVPAMVFERRHLVTGAQGEENYASILKQLAAGKAA